MIFPSQRMASAYRFDFRITRLDRETWDDDVC